MPFGPLIFGVFSKTHEMAAHHLHEPSAPDIRASFARSPTVHAPTLPPLSMEVTRPVRDRSASAHSETSSSLETERKSPEEMKAVGLQLGELIGSGSYAKVYRVFLQTKKRGIVEDEAYALKHIEYSKVIGLTSLLEPYIVKYLHTPFLVQAVEVDIDTSGNFRILQPLALGDAATLVRKQGRENRTTSPPGSRSSGASSRVRSRSPPISTVVPNPYWKSGAVKRWCWELVCAVAHLHSEGIVHGDIKAANVLLFGKTITTSSAVLSDYSISTLVMDAKIGTRDLGGKMSYTPTHRPPEVWESKQWSYSADIWALACTMYELAYQLLLFPDQRGMGDIKVSSLKAIETWKVQAATSTNIREQPLSADLPLPLNSQSTRQPISDGSRGWSPPPPAIDYKLPNLDFRWERPEMKVFNELLLSMLRVNPDERTSIWDAITHPFFNEVRDLRDLPSSCRFPLIRYSYESVPQEVVEVANRYCSDPQVVEIALALYQHLGQRPDSPSRDTSILRTCVMVAHKILYKTTPLGSPKMIWTDVQDEITLCTKLKFKLLSRQC